MSHSASDDVIDGFDIIDNIARTLVHNHADPFSDTASESNAFDFFASLMRIMRSRKSLLILPAEFLG